MNILSNSAFVVHFDIAAFFLLSVILMSLFVKGIYRQKESKLFITLIIVCIIDVIFDILASYPQFMGYYALMTLDTLYFMFRATIPFLYLLYLIQLTHTWFKYNIVIKKVLIALPYWIALALIVANIFSTNLIFDINKETLEYSRGTHFWVIYGSQGIYLLLGLLSIISYRKILNNYQKFTLLSIIPLTLGASLIQYFFGEYLIELFCQSIAFYLISSSIETKEESVDDRTKLPTAASFKTFIKRTYLNKRETHILLLRVNNYNEIYNLMSYEEAVKYLKYMSTSFANRFKGIDDKYEAYYLDEGLYAAISYDYNKLRKIAIIMNSELGHNKKRMGEYITNKNIVIFTIPKVFDNQTKLVKFINNFHNKFELDSELTFLNDLYLTKKFIIKNNIDLVIDKAFINDEFEVYYQPIYSVKDKKFNSAEALVRINSREYGFISPEYFIAYAEKIGKIADIDRKVFYQVLDFIKTDEFVNLGLEYIEINLSMVEFTNDEIIEKMTEALKVRNIPKERLNVEITENATATHLQVDKNIIGIAERGIRLSLDDYGTGYSNIERLTNLPFSLIKVDKSLVDDSDKENMHRVLKNTFNMIKELDRKSVVEGVETKEQLERFINYGADYIQGFYFSKPLTLNEFKEFIKKENFK